MVEEAFTKNYSTGTVWDPPLWIPYSSMMIGAALMILQYIAEIIKLIIFFNSILFWFLNG